MVNKSTKGRIIIIGGSMGGLFTAVSLRRHGWNVDIYERAGEALANRGAGIATHNELYDALREAGVELRNEMGIRSIGRMMFNIDGSIIGTHDMPQIMTSWGLIYRFLRQQIPDAHYHNTYSLVDLNQDAQGVSATFENGEEIHGDWLIAADGARSTVRGIVAPDIELKYCGYYGWRGLIDETLIPPEVLHEVADRMAFCMAPGGHWLGYLVAGPNDELEIGKRWYNWGWYRTGNAAVLRDHLTDSTGTYHEHGIPHGLLRLELVAAMRDEARRTLAPQVQKIVQATAHPFIQGMYDVGSERMRYGKVCVIGDAAFTARPHVGMGVSKAADDASKLAAALSAPDQDTALAKWEDARVRFGRAVLQWGRDLGSYIGPPPPDDAARAKAAHYQRPEILLSVTAATDPYPYLNLD
ncbi:MAG: FAD-dependent oxidoreductase [Proteobacteria bacterium]|nr:MAG: FAD-dependent oxidoreductase [Pseudomonadota bacterium]